jgi:hypothetical protein
MKVCPTTSACMPEAASRTTTILIGNRTVFFIEPKWLSESLRPASYVTTAHFAPVDRPPLQPPSRTRKLRAGYSHTTASLCSAKSSSAS